MYQNRFIFWPGAIAQSKPLDQDLEGATWDFLGFELEKIEGFINRNLAEIKIFYGCRQTMIPKIKYILRCQFWLHTIEMDKIQ